MNREIVTEVYSRVSGYFRPVCQWNKAKQEEFTERKFASKEFVIESVKETAIAQPNSKS